MLRPAPSALLAACLCAPSLAQSSTVVGFDGGSPDGFTGNFFFEAAGGNPDGNAHIALVTFFPSLRTGGIGEPSNPAFLGDYSGFDEVTFRMDVRVDQLTDPFIGNPIQRPLGIALIDRDIQGPSGPSGVFFTLANLSSAAQPDWTELSVVIDDPTSTTLPTDWIGFGDEDPSTFEPILPAGATFASVLASVDEVRITGAVPGFFFNNALFDMRIDNVEVELGSDGIGTEICGGVANSTGVGADLNLEGSAVAAANNLTFSVSSLPPNQNGYFLTSMGTTVVSMPGGSQGDLCIAGEPIGRFVGNVLNSGAAGAVSFSPDLTALPTPSGTEPALAGETRYFQFWYRDVVSMTTTSNLSSADGLTFL